MNTKENIALIGMPAAGKTTIGHLLSKKIGFKFLDSDDVIQEKEQQTLAQIIDSKGLDTFLEIEEHHVTGIDCKGYVIATGGSVVYSKKAMNHLSSFCTIVYLSMELSGLLTRLCDLTSRGVAITPGKSIEDLYKERTPLYDRYCDIKIDCCTMTIDQVIETAVKSLS